MPVTHWKKRNGTLKGGNGVKRCWMWTCELRCPLVDKSSTHRPLWGAALACPGADLHPPTADPSWWEGLWWRDAQRHKHSLNLNRRFLNLFCVCVCPKMTACVTEPYKYRTWFCLLKSHYTAGTSSAQMKAKTEALSLAAQLSTLTNR